MKRVLSLVLVMVMIIPSLFAMGSFAAEEGLKAAPPGESIGPTVPDWTLLVWMANDNSPTLPWQDDIDEMLAANTTASIIVLYDGNGSADSRLFSVENGEIVNLTAPFFSTEINTGSPFQLSDFVVWGMENYPSRHVWVDLWGHGNGWKGVCRDLHPSDVLTPSELGRAFDDVKERTGKNVEILTFDACRMGAMSVLYDLQGSVDYVLSSEKDVPEKGLPYTEILDDLSASPEETSRMMVDRYVRWASVNSAYSVTYSAANMSLFPSFIGEFNGYMRTAASLVPYRYGEIWEARNRSENYEAPAMYDLRDFIEKLRQVDYLLNSAGSSLTEKYNETFFEMHYSNPVPQNGIRAANAGGISVYFPIQVFSDYTTQTFYQETEWGHFIETMEKRYEPGRIEMNVSYEITDRESGPGSITLNLETENGTGLTCTAYLMSGGKETAIKRGFPQITINPDGPGNYSVRIYLWKNGSLYNEEELTGISVPAVLKLYGIIHTTSGKTLMGGVTVTNPATGKEAVAVSNESGYVLLLNMPDFCSMGDTLEIKTTIGGVETTHRITVTDYTARSNFIQIDGYGNTTTEETGQSEGQNIYFAAALVSLQLMAIALIATEWRKRE